MEVALLLEHSQYAIPVGIVLICAILVFTFGFKKAEQPPFAQLSDVDRKFSNKKRGKTKDKKIANGQASSEKASPLKKTVSSSKVETTKKSGSKVDEPDIKTKEKKQEDNRVVAAAKKNQLETKTSKENKVEQTKNTKNLKNLVQEKPLDFDEGDWEQAYSRKDKKNKKKEEESPSKKNKKNLKKINNEIVTKKKESEKSEIKDKVAKETENKELKEKEKKEAMVTTTTPVNKTAVKEQEIVGEKEQSKTGKVEKEEKKSGKAKKIKAASEGENTTVSSAPATISETEKVIESTGHKKKKIVENVVEKTDAKNEQVLDNLTSATEDSEDTWTEAKPQKKNKKKARKDN